MTDLKMARDRLIGIALGLVVYGLVEHLLWPVHAGERIRTSFVDVLRTVARLATVANQQGDESATIFMVWISVMA